MGKPLNNSKPLFDQRHQQHRADAGCQEEPPGKSHAEPFIPRRLKKQAGNITTGKVDLVTAFGDTGGAMTWAELREDKTLQDLPYKIELNRQGQIIMSPHKRIHSRLQRRIAKLLEDKLAKGEAWPGTALATKDGIKVVNIGWFSPVNLDREETWGELNAAPEICVEIRSDAHSWQDLTRKMELYLEAGALEAWICTQTGQMTFFDKTGRLEHSKMCPDFPRQLELG